MRLTGIEDDIFIFLNLMISVMINSISITIALKSLLYIKRDDIYIIIITGWWCNGMVSDWQINPDELSHTDES